MPSSTLFLNTPISPSLTKARPRPRGRGAAAFTCRASATPPSSWAEGIDLYGLLGVESTSGQPEIKRAYRALQKRCHPDVAGPAGHDMAIVLNDVYALLSDPAARSAYDQEQAKLSEFTGYTGRPLYSAWHGPEGERRAVFVDEVRCVGCLKCALHASKTFAIESAHGRARVVAQWADPEPRILDAIQACPVDCISIVERSDLAALEFLMSKQPRGSVRMTGGGSTGGVRVADVFAEVDKFQRRFKASKKEPEGSDHRRESVASAVQRIISISNWWYWRAPASERDMSLMISRTQQTPRHPDTERLREAVAKLRSRKNARPAGYNHDEDYWNPTLTLPSPPPPSSPPSPSPNPSPSVMSAEVSEKGSERDTATTRRWSAASLRVPLAMAAAAAVTVGGRGGGTAGRGLGDHVGGSMALEVVNSLEMQVVLAGFTWFVIGMGIVGMFGAVLPVVLPRRQ